MALPCATIPYYLKAKAKLQELCGIDERTLALFRVMIALTVMVDLSSFLSVFSVFLTDDGMCPRACAAAHSKFSFFLSLYYVSGSYVYSVALFVLTFIAALCLMIGYHTRVATIACWILITSLNARITPYWYSADTLLALFLFWSMFLPLGAYYSVDNALARTRIQLNKSRLFISIATLAILLQHSYVYTMGALLKKGSWLDGSAIAASLHMIQYRTAFSFILEKSSELMEALNWFVYHLELYTLPLLFFPVFTPYIRIILFLLITAMHMGFMVFLNVGYFPLVSITGMILFIPSMLWQQLKNHRFDHVSAANVVLYYDGDCGFCKKICLILREFSIYRDAPIIPAQDEEEIYQLLQKHNSWVVRTHQGVLLIKWEAVTYLLSRSLLLFPIGLLFKLPGMMYVGNMMYHMIATHRRWLGKQSYYLLPYRQYNASHLSFAGSGIVFLCAVLVLYINIRHIEGYKYLPFDKNVKMLADVTHLNQKWAMFRNPSRSHSKWMTITGTLSDGTAVNLLHDREPFMYRSIPAHMDEIYANSRWIEPAYMYKWKKYGANYGKSMCRIYNKTATVPLKHITVILYNRIHRFSGNRVNWPRRSKKLNYRCEIT